MIIDGLDEMNSDHLWEYLPNEEELEDGVYILLTSRDPFAEELPSDIINRLSHLYIEYWSTLEEAEEYKGILSENQDKVDYMTRMELYRLLDEVEPIDGGLNLEAEATSESFGKTCAELCRIMDYLPWEVVEGIFTPEALIHILRHRDNDH